MFHRLLDKAFRGCPGKYWEKPPARFAHNGLRGIEIAAYRAFARKEAGLLNAETFSAIHANSTHVRPTVFSSIKDPSPAANLRFQGNAPFKTAL